MAQATSESLEYLLRQQSKVKNHKSLVKVVRAHTRELKRQRRAKTDETAIQVLGEVSKELIRAVGNTAAGVSQAHGTAIGAWLGNPDPLTWAGGAAAFALYIFWLEHVLGTLGDKLGIPFIKDLLPSLKAGALISDVADAVKSAADALTPDPLELPANPVPAPGQDPIVNPPAPNCVTHWVVKAEGITGFSNLLPIFQFPLGPWNFNKKEDAMLKFNIIRLLVHSSQVLEVRTCTSWNGLITEQVTVIAKA